MLFGRGQPRVGALGFRSQSHAALQQWCPSGPVLMSKEARMSPHLHLHCSSRGGEGPTPTLTGSCHRRPQPDVDGELSPLWRPNAGSARPVRSSGPAGSAGPWSATSHGLPRRHLSGFSQAGGACLDVDCQRMTWKSLACIVNCHGQRCGVPCVSQHRGMFAKGRPTRRARPLPQAVPPPCATASDQQDIASAALHRPFPASPFARQKPAPGKGLGCPVLLHAPAPIRPDRPSCHRPDRVASNDAMERPAMLRGGLLTPLCSTGLARTTMPTTTRRGTRQELFVLWRGRGRPGKLTLRAK